MATLKFKESNSCSKGRGFESTPRTSVVRELSHANCHSWTERRTIQWSPFELKTNWLL